MVLMSSLHFPGWSEAEHIAFDIAILREQADERINCGCLDQGALASQCSCSQSSVCMMRAGSQACTGPCASLRWDHQSGAGGMHVGIASLLDPCMAPAGCLGCLKAGIKAGCHRSDSRPWAAVPMEARLGTCRSSKLMQAEAVL